MGSLLQGDPAFGMTLATKKRLQRRLPNNRDYSFGFFFSCAISLWIHAIERNGYGIDAPRILHIRISVPGACEGAGRTFVIRNHLQLSLVGERISWQIAGQDFGMLSVAPLDNGEHIQRWRTHSLPSGRCIGDWVPVQCPSSFLA